MDIIVNGSCSIDNPFYADVVGEFYGPGKRVIVIPAFFDGDSIWKLRFSPTIVGAWELKIQSEHVKIETTQFYISVEENNNRNIHGGLCVDRENPYSFRFEDGTRQFIIGYECNWLWAMAQAEDGMEKVKKLIGDIKNFGFNQVVMNMYAHDCEWEKGHTSVDDYGPPGLYLWEGSNEIPDHSRINTEFFHYYDKVMELLMMEGITVHLYLKVYNKMVNWPAKYSLEERMYMKYAVARYQAYPNVIWDFSKEGYYESDHSYLRYGVQMIRSYDGYGRLLTLHDTPEFYRDANSSRLLDFVTIQKHDEFYTSVLLEREKKQWPVFYAELGYEYGPKGPGDVTYGVGQSPEELIKRAYMVALGGAVPNYYYTYTAWDVIKVDYIPKGYHYFKIMSDIFNEVEWWKMEPYPEVLSYKGYCLAEPEKQYLIFGNSKYRALVNLDLRGRKFDAIWVNIYTGKKVEALRQKSNQSFVDESKTIFTCPFEESPSILSIKLLD